MGKQFFDQKDLNKEFCKKQDTSRRKCEVLFPDETIISSAELIQSHTCGNEYHLQITIHGATFVIGEGYFDDLKFKFAD